MTRLALGTFALLALGSAGCESKKAPVKMAPAEANRASGWVGAMAAKPESAQALLDSDAGWVALYKRDYRAAADGFAGEAATSKTGKARAHLALAQLGDALSRLLVSTTARYFDERDKLGDKVGALESGTYFAAVAKRLEAGEDEGLKTLAKGGGPYAVLAQAWLTDCKAAKGWQRPIAAMLCGQPMCDGEDSAPPDGMSEEWTRRLATYQRGLCGSASDSELQTLAQTPALVEVIPAKSADVPDGRLELHDPIALRALAIHHYRAAIAADGEAAVTARAKKGLGQSGPNPAATDSLALLVFSPWPDATTAADLSAPELPASADPLVTAAGASRRATRRAVQSLGTEVGAAMVTGLKIEDAIADAELRRIGRAALDADRCDLAFPLLHASYDLAAPDAVSYRNEPRYLAELATAAMCARRSSTAIGAARALASKYPEANGALAALRSLAAAWVVIGGAEGVQRSQ